MVELNIELSGSGSYAARFGESIANLGDIDNDGFEGTYITPLGLILSGALDCHDNQEYYGSLRRLSIGGLTFLF